MLLVKMIRASLLAGAWIVGIAAVSNIAEEANRLLRCENGEVLMDKFAIGLDGRLARQGSYCYRPAPSDAVERWTTDDDGEPVRVQDARPAKR